MEVVYLVSIYLECFICRYTCLFLTFPLKDNMFGELRVVNGHKVDSAAPVISHCHCIRHVGTKNDLFLWH